MTLVRNRRLANRLNSGQVIATAEGRRKACKVWQIKGRAGACAHGSIAIAGETFGRPIHILCGMASGWHGDRWSQAGSQPPLPRSPSPPEGSKAARYGDLTQQRAVLVATQPPQA